VFFLIRYSLVFMRLGSLLRHFAAQYGDTLDSCDEGFYKYCFGGAIEAVLPGWPSSTPQINS